MGTPGYTLHAWATHPSSSNYTGIFEGKADSLRDTGKHRRTSKDTLLLCCPLLCSLQLHLQLSSLTFHCQSQEELDSGAPFSCLCTFPTVCTRPSAFINSSSFPILGKGWAPLAPSGIVGGHQGLIPSHRPLPFPTIVEGRQNGSSLHPPYFL